MKAITLLKKYSVIPVMMLASGVVAMIISNVDAATNPAHSDDWPQAQLTQAATAAIAFKRDQGRLPASLDELRAARAGTYLPKGFDLAGVMYFREGGETPPRLSWRDDVAGLVAYCRLDAAIQKRCR
ncbi:hypothetical protein [Burkholderia sp. Ac-20365]|uniref:hypothetical protein n=1 Tax=Burkholderia sp. Ac-20365 TaxID=2703897 RepID=UPI00197C1B86|nr:hypothetical protein [Burkholderia sp. Ac-20365]MBN3761324.1 hypothetical protein [Burkholderia sp. Ac-20365]